MAEMKYNDPSLSLVKGPAEPPLYTRNLGQLLEEQARKYPDRKALIVPWTKETITYRQLNDNSKALARGLLALGVRRGDRVGISAGNCNRYCELFFAVCRIGATILVLNPAYTAIECEHALRHSGCKILFTPEKITRHERTRLIELLAKSLDDRESGRTLSLPDLKHVVILRGDASVSPRFKSHEWVIERGSEVPMSRVDELTDLIDPMEVCNLQFTSGTTGSPKAAMLTHHGLINNGRIIGHGMQLTEQDVFCSPPPLFHGFGIFLCLMTSVHYGCCLVFPNDVFDASATLQSLLDYRCTGFNGVPTMYVAVLQEARKQNLRPGKVRTGITSGAPVPGHLMQDFKEIFDMPDLTIIYGLTETTGSVFQTSVWDKNPEKIWTVGTVCPHTSAKVISPEGEILPRGARGELCISGYCNTTGYFRNEEKTRELLEKDSHGNIWLHTGDEATIDDKGYCRITGRIKDIIIRGGENIYPTEIENRLAAHPSIAQSSVVGLKDEKYQEIVAAFVEQRPDSVGKRPSDDEIRAWVRETLGRFKAPARVFWIGRAAEGADRGKGTVDSGLDVFPTTASGKIRKVELREFGNRWLDREKGAKL